jgi:hypothetical protein
MGIPLVRGRDFGWSDVRTAPHMVLVNEAFVRRLIPQGEPLGRRISEVLGPGNDPWTIAGVIGDVHTKGLDRAPAPLIVVPLMQYAVPGLRVAMRAASGDPLSLLPALRADVAALYRVSTTDPLTLATTAAVLIGAAALASWVPARRATRVDPAVSLRVE